MGHGGGQQRSAREGGSKGRAGWVLGQVRHWWLLTCQVLLAPPRGGVAHKHLDGVVLRHVGARAGAAGERGARAGRQACRCAGRSGTSAHASAGKSPPSRAVLRAAALQNLI